MTQSEEIMKYAKLIISMSKSVALEEIDLDTYIFNLSMALENLKEVKK